MSISYRVLLKCDRCDEEHQLHEDWRAPSTARWGNISVRGWHGDVNEGDGQYGHVCPDCWKEIHAAKKSRP